MLEVFLEFSEEVLDAEIEALDPKTSRSACIRLLADQTVTNPLLKGLDWIQKIGEDTWLMSKSH